MALPPRSVATAALLLLLPLAGAIALGVARRAERPAAGHAAARLVTVEVGGMVCSGCVAKIHGQLTQVPGVWRADVSLRDQRAQVLCDRTVADTALTAAVRRAGPEYLGIVVGR
jgi:copper chaperone CopZ